MPVLSDPILDHVGVAVSDLARSQAFYEAALEPLGITALTSFPGGCALGRGTHPELWLAAGKAGYQTRESRAIITQQHVCLKARSRAEVDAFHAAAIAAGGRSYGAPGLRGQVHPTYYGAFVLDPDGHNVEAVFHGPV